MFQLLLVMIYLAFISLGLPDSLLVPRGLPCIRNFPSLFPMREGFP